MSRLKVTETFVSIQGEADAVGWPTLFIRLTGCPLRCVYCDTQYAFYGGDWRTLGHAGCGASGDHAGLHGVGQSVAADVGGAAG